MAFRCTLAVLGLLIVMYGTGSVVNTMLIPRGAIGPLFGMVDHTINAAFRSVTSRIRSYERRDGVLAAHAPALLIANLFSWLGVFAVGFTFMLLPAVPDPHVAVREAVSSMFTLGFTTTLNPWATVVDALAALSGITTVALQIGYLPTLYGAYNRRETEITLLAVRAGEPAWGVELLARTHYGFHGGDLGLFYSSWERWAADLAESHTSYRALVRFRSPKASRSWLVGMLAVLDAAALQHSISPKEAPVEARLLLRMGFICLRRLAEAMGLPIDEDPRPNAPIQLSYEAFAEGYDRIARVGFPMERSVDEAWPHFRGWRVNYEATAYALAWELDAVPARWSGPRRTGDFEIDPIRPPNRTPEDPDSAGGRPVVAD
jgi:hypothetical protein